MSGTKRLTIDVHLPVEEDEIDASETHLGLRPTSIKVSGLTPKEAGRIAEGWAQSDAYWVGVTSAIIDKLHELSQTDD